jgi:hypothetical protein
MWAGRWSWRVEPSLAVQPGSRVLPLAIDGLRCDVALNAGNQIFKAGELTGFEESLLGSAALNLVGVVPIPSFEVGFARARLGCVSILFLCLCICLLGRHLAVT